MSLRKDIKRRQQHQAEQRRKKRAKGSSAASRSPQQAKPLQMEPGEPSAIYTHSGGCADFQKLKRSLARVYKG